MLVKKYLELGAHILPERSTDQGYVLVKYELLTPSISLRTRVVYLQNRICTNSLHIGHFFEIWISGIPLKNTPLYKNTPLVPPDLTTRGYS